MNQNDHQQRWQDYCDSELAKIRPLLARFGFALDAVQPHLEGERAVISGKKLVLLGKRLSDGQRVVIKASSYPEGQGEMHEERRSRQALSEIHFAYRIFFSPEQLLWHEEDDCLLCITTFLEQERALLERPLNEQFFLALNAFETQESAHAATFEQQRTIRRAFQIYDTTRYLNQFQVYQTELQELLPNQAELHRLIERVGLTLRNNRERIEQYTGFLTHTDFVPHNFRVVQDKIYLLDHSSIRFGNKHDGWARFLNFMLLHHRALETALTSYFRDNRSPEENESLFLMRLYRLTEIIWYYARRAQKSSGDLQQLDQTRIVFWTTVLQSLVDKQPLTDEQIAEYTKTRDQLRTEEEKRRQKGLH